MDHGMMKSHHLWKIYIFNIYNIIQKYILQVDFGGFIIDHINIIKILITKMTQVQK